MNLSELLGSDRIRAAEWTISEQRLVIEEVLGLVMVDQILREQESLSQEQIEKLLTIAARSRRGEPVAYILGVVYFDGLRLSVTSDVLIPRLDTEMLVAVASASIPRERAIQVHDMCTGSGAVALALKSRHPKCEMSASDICRQAIACARANAVSLKIDVQFRQADLFDGMGMFDLVTANPPYVAWGDPEVEAAVKRYEPELAVFSAANGLALIEQLLTDALNHVRSGGILCLEHGHRQAHDVYLMASDLGWQIITTYQDLAGRDRVTRMHKP
ncbi:MAG: protein-(glutamine-N5) methyltransferase, release factor-specific [Gammaproteobacteria bacterium]|nr:protein-(glutamine-N5) methyltransferase, release factor-specific [Gammaproteobacteria bacterium]